VPNTFFKKYRELNFHIYITG